MSWRIEYRDREGQIREHINNNNVSDAKGWAENLSKESGYAKLIHVADGPYDYSGKKTTIVTHGE